MYIYYIYNQYIIYIIIYMICMYIYAYKCIYTYSLIKYIYIYIKRVKKRDIFMYLLVRISILNSIVITICLALIRLLYHRGRV